MKPALIEDYRNPTYRALARSVLTNILLENKKIPMAIAMDSTIIHYKHWTTVVFNPDAKGAWKTILEKYYETEEYKTLNNVVAGDPLLAKYATIHFLNKLFKKAEEELRRRPKAPEDYYSKTIDPSKSHDEDAVEKLMKALDTEVSRGQYMQASRTINEIVETLAEEAEEIKKDIEAIEAFTHAGIPVAKLLENPEEFRRRARNKIIVNLVRFLRKLRREAPGLKQTKMPTLVGGRPLGVKRLQRWSELTETLPSETIDDDLMSYKIASRSILVRERYGSIIDYTVYLDRSGSMGDGIEYCSSPTQCEYVPKISFAAASALALATALRRVGGKMTLKLFDVEVHDPVSDYTTLIDTLLRISADSGTNISNVLEDAVKNHREDKVVVITDGIDYVNEEAVKKARSANLDITFVFIKTDNELLRKNFPCIRIERAKPDILLQV